MIDIHSHILPGIDDGPKDEQGSINMAIEAVEQGITAVVATPHHKNRTFDNDAESIEKNTSIFQNLLNEKGIPLTVFPGQETRIHGSMVEGLEEGTILPLNHTNYVHVEMPSDSVPRYAQQLLYDMQRAGYIPIIVHPERNRDFLRDPQLLYTLVQNGALTQVTAASLLGKFGKEMEKFSHQIIEANLTHFIASDAHNNTTRNNVLADALEHINQTFGIDDYYMFIENAECIVSGRPVHQMEPQPIKRKKFLGLF